MKMPSLHFPQISRFFSAPLFTAVFFWSSRVILWSLLITLFYFNITTKLNPSSALPSYILSALRSPFSLPVHTDAASILWNKGLSKEAKVEIAIAQDLTPPGELAVLGTSTSPASLLHQWEAQPKITEGLFTFWKSVIETKPDYRDAYIQAGIFAYELGRTQDAIDLLQKAQLIDPNLQATTTILSNIQK